MADYAGVSMPQVEDLDVFTFFLLLHDGVIWRLSKTEKGREYLDTAARLRMTEPEPGLPGRL